MATARSWMGAKSGCWRGSLRANFRQELGSRAALVRPVLGGASPDVGLDLGVAELEVVLELVDVHDPGERDAVLLEDHAFLVQVDALDDGAEGVPGLGEGKTLNHGTWLEGFNGAGSFRQGSSVQHRTEAGR